MSEQVLQLQSVVNDNQLGQAEEDSKLEHANTVIEHLNIRLQREVATNVDLREKYDELEIANAQLQVSSFLKPILANPSRFLN